MDCVQAEKKRRPVEKERLGPEKEILLARLGSFSTMSFFMIMGNPGLRRTYFPCGRFDFVCDFPVISVGHTAWFFLFFLFRFFASRQTSSSTFAQVCVVGIHDSLIVAA